MSDNNNININTPEIGPYTQLRPFRFWCQKVLPLVYDESLSYYELLCKVVDYLNKTMEDVDQMITDMGEFKTADTEFKTEVRDAYIAFSREVSQAVEGLETFINNYFNNLNVQTEINNKLDAMAEAGYFDTLFTTLFTDDIITEAGNVTSAWIAENLLQETGYVIDNSLTVASAAADAKAAGDRIRQAEADIAGLTNEDIYLTSSIYRKTGEGNRTQPSDSSAADIIAIGEKMQVGHTYRIFLKFNNYKNGNSDADTFTKLTAFYVATGTSGSDRVTDLLTQLRTAMKGASTDTNVWGNLDKWIFLDYTATAAITHLRPQYSSSFLSDSASIDWKIVDLSSVLYANAETQTIADQLNDKVLYKTNEGTKGQGGSYTTNSILLTEPMYAGVEYQIELYFDGPYTGYSEYVNNLYTATGTAADDRVDSIYRNVAPELWTHPRNNTWFKFTYTPPVTVNRICPLYSSSYSASDDNKIKYVIRNAEGVLPLKEAVNSGKVFNFTPVDTWPAEAVPENISNILNEMNNDILITFVGDSLTGLIEYSGAQADPEHCPPGMQYESWTWRIWNNLARVKAVCDRLDSQRGGVDFFATTGTWEAVGGEKFDDDDYAYDFEHERSVAANTFQSASDNAAVTFVFDADSYEKGSIVFSLQPDGADCEIEISEGNGKLLVSLDRSTWVEANGYSHTQNSNPDGLNYAQIQAAGLAIQQRHRRLWLKRAVGVTGDITVTYKKSSTQTLLTPYMYCWGCERWNGNSVFIDNLGRGGRYTRTLSYNISDIFDRNPDFAVYEMPLANETDEGYANIQGFYTQYFNSAGNNSYKTRSNDYTEVPLIVFLPSGRGTFFGTNDEAVFDSENQVVGDPPAYVIYKEMYEWLKNLLSDYDNVSVIDLYDKLLNEASGIDELIKNVFGSKGEYSLTQDTTHLNSKGARMYNKYLLPLFQK